MEEVREVISVCRVNPRKNLKRKYGKLLIFFMS